MVKPSTIQRLVHDPWTEGIWIGTSHAGLFHKPLNSPGLTHQSVLDGLPSGNIFEIEPTPETLWIGTKRGPAILDKATGDWTRPTLVDGANLTAPTRNVHIEAGTAWIGTDTEGLYRWAPGSDHIEAIPNPVNGTRFSHPILGIQDEGPMLYISAAGYGLVAWDRETGEAKRYGQNLYRPAGGPYYARLTITGPDLWIATQEDGAVRWNRSSDEVHEYYGPGTINARSVLNMATLGDEVWFATPGGVARYDRGIDHWTRYTRTQGNYAWSNPTDITLAQGALYVSTRIENRIATYDRENDQWVEVDWWDRDRMPSFNEILDCDRDGDKIVYSTGGGDALYHDPTTGIWEHVDGGAERANGTASVLVYQTEVLADSMWFATAKGISWWNKTTDQWHQHRTDGRGMEAAVAYDNQVRDLAVSGDSIWAATFSTKPETTRGEQYWNHGGLSRYDRATGTWTNWSTEDGLPAENVSKVALAGGDVWLGTGDHGLVRFDPATETFEQVYPADGLEGVLSLMAHDDQLYVGTVVHGVVRVDATTHEATELFKPRMPAVSMTWDDGRLWVGTNFGGFYQVDPSTGEHTAYHTGHFEDFWAHCFLREGDILHVGTQWGVHRLHLPTGRFLPQVLYPGTLESSPREASLSLHQPAPGQVLPDETPIEASGTAHAPENTTLQARVDQGPWTTTEATDTWQLTLAPPGTGTHTLTIQLVHEGRVAAQTTRVIHLGDPSQTDAPGPRFQHTPPLEAIQGQDLTMTVQASQLPDGIEATLTLEPPGTGQAHTVQLEPEDGRLAGTLEVPETPGQATYRITITWADGSTQLPGPHSPMGQRYPLLIRAIQGHAEGLILAPDIPDALEPGQRHTLTLPIQNVGSRSAELMLTTSGQASAWLRSSPQPTHLEPASSHDLLLDLAVPDDATPGTHSLELTLAPTDPTAGTGDTRTLELTVAGDQAEEEPAGTPGPGLLALLSTLASVAWTIKRSGEDR